MSDLTKSDVAIITAGNWVTGTNKQIATPKLTAARIAADYFNHKGPLLWSASKGDFARLHLHVPNDMDAKLWSRAFLIRVDICSVRHERWK